MCFIQERKTKIICTLGPASETEDVLKQMILAGMNIARFNMSHGSYADHERRMNLVRKCAKDLQRPVGLLLDTKGPEVRVRSFKGGKAEIKTGQKFTFTTEDCVGDNTKVSITFPDLPRDMKKGYIIYVNDGRLQFEVDAVRGNNIICDCIKGGVISNSKSMNFPKITLSLPYMSQIDREDILFGIRMKVDFIAASFVGNKDNVLQIRQLIDTHGETGKIDIIAKIESHEGVQNINEIFQVSEGVMIARGDMGVEIPFEQLPGIQKYLVTRARTLGKRVVVATEMLESMIENPRPTRAETSDISNAVYDGASCVMLSGESAAGKHPVECVKTMSLICETTEKKLDFLERLRILEFSINDSVSAIAHAAVHASHTLHAKLIIVFTGTGRSARMISRFRPGVPIIAATFDERAYSRLSMSWGVSPMLVKEYKDTDGLFELATYIAHQAQCKLGDTYIVTAAAPITENTNILKVCVLK